MEKSSLNTSRAAGAVFTAILAVSLFAAWPLVFLYPPGLRDINHPYLVRFPVEIALAAVSLCFLIIHRYKFAVTPRKLFLCLGLFAAATAGSTLVNKSHPEEALELLGMLLIPAAVAVLVLQKGVFNTARSIFFIHFFAFMWFCLFLWSYWSQRPIGLSGNQNWFASTFLALAPWAFFSLYHILRILFSRFLKGVDANIPAGLTAFGIISVITFFWLAESRCRAVWLALILFAIFTVIMKFSVKIRIGAVLLLIAGVVLFTQTSKFDEMSRNDIRVPLYLSTVKMVMSSPVLGLGPGQFRKHYPGFKTPAQSLRTISANVTEYPHNEFLHIASQIGLPASLIWLGICVSLLLMKVRTREGHCARFGMFIIFIHSFFDTVLVSAPGNILFLVFSGILAARWCRNKVETVTHKGILFPVTCLASLLCLLPVGMRVADVTRAQLQYRKTSVIHSLDDKGLVKGLREAVLKEIYNGYIKAAEYDPFNVLYPYMAAHIALERLKMPGLAQKALLVVRRLESNYQHTNYLSALYHLQTPVKTDEEFKKKLELVDQRMSYELKLHPFNLQLSKFIIDRYIDMRQKNRANNLFKYSSNSCVNMFSFKHGDRAKTLADKWVKSINDSEHGIEDANSILHGFKGTDTIDSLLPSLTSPKTSLAGLVLDKFNKTDQSYWKEIIQLRKIFDNNNGQSGQYVVDSLLNKLNITRKGEFKWPAEVLDSKEGSELSVCCLLRIAAHCHGNLSFLVRAETLDKVHWLVYLKNDDEEFLVWPSQSKIIKGKLVKLLESDNFDREIGDKVRRVTFHIFEYPQAFFMKNVYLSKIVSGVLGDFPDFCSTPSLVKMNLEAFLNKRWRLNYLKEPFLRLEQDISRE